MKNSYQIIYSGSRIELPAELLPRLQEISGEELKALILLAAADGNTPDLAAGGLTEEEFEGAAAFLRGAGLIGKKKKAPAAAHKDGKATVKEESGLPETEEEKKTKEQIPQTKEPGRQKDGTRPVKVIRADRMPEYTGAELKEKIAGNPLLESLIRACENTLGKTFNPTDINRLVAMHETLGLDGEYILLLLADCARRDKKNLLYAERMACGLLERGIVTPAELEEEFRRREELSSAESELRRMFGIGRRALTQKETDIFSRWISDRRFSMELIREAYEITVKNTREASIPYTDKILESWFEAGIKTPEEARNSQSKRPAQKTGKGSFNTEDFFNAALKRSIDGK